MQVFLVFQGELRSRKIQGGQRSVFRGRAFPLHSPFSAGVHSLCKVVFSEPRAAAFAWVPCCCAGRAGLRRPRWHKNLAGLRPLRWHKNLAGLRDFLSRNPVSRCRHDKVPCPGGSGGAEPPWIIQFSLFGVSC